MRAIRTPVVSAFWRIQILFASTSLISPVAQGELLTRVHSPTRVIFLRWGSSGRQTKEKLSKMLTVINVDWWCCKGKFVLFWSLYFLNITKISQKNGKLSKLYLNFRNPSPQGDPQRKKTEGLIKIITVINWEWWTGEDCFVVVTGFSVISQ